MPGPLYQLGRLCARQIRDRGLDRGRCGLACGSIGRPRKRIDGVAAAGGASPPLLRSPARPARRRHRARRSAPQLRGRGQGSVAADAHLRRGAWLEAPAAPLLRQQHLQPRLITGRPRTDRRCRCSTGSTATAKPCATFGARSVAPGRATLDRTIAASARLSCSGARSTSRGRGARPTGTSRSGTHRLPQSARGRRRGRRTTERLPQVGNGRQPASAWRVIASGSPRAPNALPADDQQERTDCG